MCCECGGGTHYFPPTSACSDTSGGAKNIWHEKCHDYDGAEEWCGNDPFQHSSGDDNDFVSHVMCCSCGGGSYTVDDAVRDDTWSVPHKAYKMSAIRMWKSVGEVSGFEVVYSPPSSYTGWPDETHMFGSQTETSAYDSKLFTEDITGLEICMDLSTPPQM